MKRFLTNNFGLKIASLAAAVLLWFVVVNIDNPISTRTFGDIQVQVLNANQITDAGKTYQVLDHTDVVSVTVTAKRSVLDKLGKEDIAAYADMRDYDSDLGTVKIRPTVTNYESANCTANPVNMRVRIEDLESRQLPITVETKGSPADGYKVGSTSVNPESVTVSGPRSMVNKVAKAVVTVDVNGLYEDKTLPAALVLYDDDGNQVDMTLIQDNLDDDGVAVSVKILNTKKVDLVIEGVTGTPAGGYEMTEVSVEPAAVTIAGRKDILDKIDSITIPDSAVDINGATEKVEKVINISGYLPDGAALADKKDASVLVTVAVAKIGTKTIEIPVLSLKVSNAPDDLELSYTNNDNIQIICEGPQAALETLTADDVEASLNLNGYTEKGKYKVKADIKLPDGVALSEDVVVGVELKEKEEAPVEITDAQNNHAAE